MNTQTTVPVPKPLWDELESALMIKAKQLIGDLAKTLRQDEKQLLQEFRAKKTNLFLVDLEMDTDEYYCSAILDTTKVAQKCRKPAMFGQSYCPQHQFFVLPTELQNKARVQRISYEEPLFVDPLTQLVYTSDYERVGSVKNGKCMLFELEE